MGRLVKKEGGDQTKEKNKTHSAAHLRRLSGNPL